MRARLVAAVAAAAMLTGATSATTDKAFVGCPIVRDTRTVPCWLAEENGELYYLGIQTDVSADFHPPSLGHKVLVEGRVTSQPRICGGIVLDQVKVSVMPERADNCNTLLMAEDRYALPFAAPRPPGPSTGRLAFSYAPPPPLPAPPFKAREFEILYDFDGLVGFSHPRQLTPIMAYAQHIGAKRIEVTGYRAAVRLDDGSLLTERETIGRQRAQQIADLLQGAGLDGPTYVVDAKDRPEVGDSTKRRVRVVVSP